MISLIVCYVSKSLIYISNNELPGQGASHSSFDDPSQFPPGPGGMSCLRVLSPFAVEGVRPSPLHLPLIPTQSVVVLPSSRGPGKS